MEDHKMNVSIIKQSFNHGKCYQIMVEVTHGFNHVFPGKLFTLEEAKTICSANGFTVVSIGDIWQCATK
jgi:hypothetical protein